MQSNYLEQLVAEWYEYQDYFVRRNVRVGRRKQGGYEGELDVVAFHPASGAVVHIETSTDANSWAERERTFTRKFRTGEKHIPTLFHGLSQSTPIEKIAIFGVVGSRKNHQTVGGGAIKFIDEFISEIIARLGNTPWFTHAVPEQFSLIRTLQIVSAFHESVFAKR